LLLMLLLLLLAESIARSEAVFLAVDPDDGG